MKLKEESEKAGLKLQKTKIMASGLITSWQIEPQGVRHHFCSSGSGLGQSDENQPCSQSPPQIPTPPLPLHDLGKWPALWEPPSLFFHKDVHLSSAAGTEQASPGFFSRPPSPGTAPFMSQLSSSFIRKPPMDHLCVRHWEALGMWW